MNDEIFMAVENLLKNDLTNLSTGLMLRHNSVNGIKGNFEATIGARKILVEFEQHNLKGLNYKTEIVNVELDNIEAITLLSSSNKEMFAIVGEVAQLSFDTIPPSSIMNISNVGLNEDEIMLTKIDNNNIFIVPKKVGVFEIEVEYMNMSDIFSIISIDRDVVDTLVDLSEVEVE